MRRDVHFWRLYDNLYLKPKLVEEVVDEVFDEADDADVQVLACDVMEDNSGSRRRQFVPQPEVFLMAVDGHLKCQQSQHQEVVLHREGIITIYYIYYISTLKNAFMVGFDRCLC